MHLAVYLGLSLALVSRVMGANSYWVYPQPSGPPGSMAGNIDLTRGAVSTLVWFSNMTSYNVTLWQQQAGNNGANFAGIVYTADGDGLGTVQFNWLADPMATDITESNVFYLYLGFPMAGSISCHYFNMRATPLSLSSSATVVASSSAIIDASSTAPTGLANSSASASPSTAAVNASSSNQGQPATTIGLGVGLGIGLLALLIVAGVSWLKHVRKRRATPTTQTPAYTAHIQHEPPPDWYASQAYGSAHDKHGMAHTSVQRESIYEVSGRPASPVEAGAKTPRNPG